MRQVLQCPGQRHLVAIQCGINRLQPRLGITPEPLHQGLMATHLHGTGEMDPGELTAVTNGPQAMRCLPRMATALPMKHDGAIQRQTAGPWLLR